jgi:Holliday junction DNA helicase RuvA
VIGYVRGTLVGVTAETALVETAGGIGLTIFIPGSSRERLPAVGQPVRLLTQLLIREDQWFLAGFLTETERAAFLALTTVTGVGPKLALQVLTALEPAALAEAIRDGAWQRIRVVPGVGPKLAQRIAVELRGWAGATAESFVVGAGDSDRGDAGQDDEVIEGLKALGLSDAEARAAVRGLEALTPVERLREALRRLDRGRGTAFYGR